MFHFPTSHTTVQAVRHTAVQIYAKYVSTDIGLVVTLDLFSLITYSLWLFVRMLTHISHNFSYCSPMIAPGDFLLQVVQVLYGAFGFSSIVSIYTSLYET